jgi:HD superfamily phosphohydrolase
MKSYDEFTDSTLLALLLKNSLYSEVISTKTFKRLKNISFLGAIDYTSRHKKRHNRYDHSISVGTLALHYARLKQLDEYEANHLVVAALLHDVGHGPLSHSMEPVFQKRYGISHHTMTNDIIKGISKLGDELCQVLKKYHIDIDYIVELLDGKVSNETAFALTNPINIDTADGIIRTISYSYAPKNKKAHLGLLLKPKDIVEATLWSA